MTKTIANQVCDVVRANIGQDHVKQGTDDAVLMATSFSDLELDSMTKMEMVMLVEEQLAVLLNENDVQNCQTVGEFVSLVEHSVAG